MKKCIFSIMLIICILCTFLTAASADEVSNYCGDNVIWSIDNQGTLIISGVGDMFDYIRLDGSDGSLNTAPWGKLRQYVSKVLIGPGVTNIGMNAFAGFDKLTSLEIGEDVTNIGISAFEGCKNLRTISFGGCIKSVSEWAFASCESLTNIVLNEGLRSVGNYAFYNCSRVSSVTLPTTLNELGIFAFAECTSLTSVSIPSEIKNISDGLFSGCSELVVVNIPNTVERIGNRAFYNCSSMSIVSIPQKLKELESYAFYHCSALSNASIPNAITDIQDWTFGHCDGLKTVIIPEGITKIGQGAFYGCDLMNTVKFNGTLTQWDGLDIGWGNTDLFKGTFSTKDREAIQSHDKCGENVSYILDGSGVLTIRGSGAMEEYDSEKVGSELVTTAPWGEYRTKVKKIVVENGVTNVSRYAFYGLVNVTSVTLGDDVTAIGDYAFRGCSKITTVKLGKNVTDIGYSAFYACGELVDINIPSCLKVLGEGSFCYCTKLAKIVVPDGVTSIGQWTFYNCENLKSASIGKGVQTIGSSAFSGCKSLTSINVPDSVSEIKEWAFGYCAALKTVTIGTRVKSIASYAFCGCASITDVHYNGSKDQWQSINIGTYNENLLYAVIHVNKLDAPSVTAGIDAETGKPLLKWSKVKGASKYEIWRATSNTGKYSKMYTTSYTSYTNKSADVGVTYYYKIKALSSSSSMSESVFSSVVSSTCICAVPVPKASNNSDTGKIKLSWTAVDGAEEYEVWRATTKTGKYYKMTTTQKTSYTNTSAVAGSTYYYKVKAISQESKELDSFFSSPVSRVCDCAKPSVKISLSSGHPKLTWSDVDGATSYKVYRSTSKDGSYTLLGTTSNTTYVNTSASSGKIYYYKIVAVSSKSSEANSSYSTIVSIKAK